MKKIILTLVIALFVMTGQSLVGQDKGVKFEQGTFQDALAKATKENKMIFFDGYASWCGPCKRMASDVFTQESVGKYLNDNFINFKQDMEKGEGVALGQKYNIKAFPTFLILDGSGKELARIIGGAAPDAFIKKVQDAVASIKK